MHPHALVSHCSESQAKLLLRGPNRRPDNSCGKILNNSGLMEFHQQKGELSIEFRNMARLYSDILLCNEFRRFYPYILLSMKIRNMPRFYLIYFIQHWVQKRGKILPIYFIQHWVQRHGKILPIHFTQHWVQRHSKISLLFFWNKLKVTDALKKEIGNKFNLGNIIYPCIIIILNI